MKLFQTPVCECDFGPEIGQFRQDLRRSCREPRIEINRCANQRCANQKQKCRTKCEKKNTGDTRKNHSTTLTIALEDVISVSNAHRDH